VHAISVLEVCPRRCVLARVAANSGCEHGLDTLAASPSGTWTARTVSASCQPWTFATLLKSRAIWFELPMHDGKPWRLSTHQGRKTFARFAALRDRTGLFALAKHLGHRDRAITNYGYAGTDYRLNEEIDAAVLEAVRCGVGRNASARRAWAAAPALRFSRSGHDFVGSRIKQDLKSYGENARRRRDSPRRVRLGDSCVYRQPYSDVLAVNQNQTRNNGASPRRCCQPVETFQVSEKHRGYWLEQARRSEALLNEPALPHSDSKDRAHAAQRSTRCRAMPSMAPASSDNAKPR